MLTIIVDGDFSEGKKERKEKEKETKKGKKKKKKGEGVRKGKEACV